MATRGMLTEEIQEISKRFLGREISQRELRLYPYIDNCVKNFNKYEGEYISTEEFRVLNKLSEEGHITYGRGRILITPEFYDYMNSVLKLAYITDWYIK